MLLSFAFSTVKDIQHISTVCRELFTVNLELIKDLFLLVEILDYTLVVIKAQEALSL